jgi:hypothetical protein
MNHSLSKEKELEHMFNPQEECKLMRLKDTLGMLQLPDIKTMNMCKQLLPTRRMIQELAQ